MTNPLESSSRPPAVPLSPPRTLSSSPHRRSREESEHDVNFIERAAKRAKLEPTSSTTTSTSSLNNVPDLVRQEFSRVHENVLQMLEKAREAITHNLSRKEEGLKSIATNPPTPPSIEEIVDALRDLLELKNTTHASPFIQEPALQEIKNQSFILLDLFKKSNEFHAPIKHRYVCYLNEIIKSKSSKEPNQTELSDLLDLCNHSLSVELSAEGFKNKLDILKQLNKKEEEYQFAVSTICFCSDDHLYFKLAVFFLEQGNFELCLQAFEGIINNGTTDPEILKNAILTIETYLVQLPNVSTIQNEIVRNRETEKIRRFKSLADQYDQIRTQTLAKELLDTPSNSLRKYFPGATWDKLNSAQAPRGSDQENGNLGLSQKNPWEMPQHRVLTLDSTQNQNSMNSPPFNPTHSCCNSIAGPRTFDVNSRNTNHLDTTKSFDAARDTCNHWECAHSTDFPISSLRRSSYNTRPTHYSSQTPSQPYCRSTSPVEQVYQNLRNSGSFAPPYQNSNSAAVSRPLGNPQNNAPTRNIKAYPSPQDSATFLHVGPSPEYRVLRSHDHPYAKSTFQTPLTFSLPLNPDIAPTIRLSRPLEDDSARIYDLISPPPHRRTN